MKKLGRGFGKRFPGKWSWTLARRRKVPVSLTRMGNIWHIYMVMNRRIQNTFYYWFTDEPLSEKALLLIG